MSRNRIDKTLGLVITDGVGYRNFIMSDFPSVVTQFFKRVVVFSGLPSHVYKHLDPDIFEIVELPVYRESKYQWYWRKLRETSHLQKFPDNFGMADNLKLNYRRGWKPNDILIKSIYLWSGLNRSEKQTIRFENYRNKSFIGDPVYIKIETLLKNYNPDLLFFTHQRPPFIATLAYAAKKCQIPTTTFIFSWDNLASKGRMAADFDHHLVWSDLMQKELLEYYKKLTADQITVVGTPQFEPYVLPQFDLNRNWFFEYFNLDPNKKTICYSCADKSIGANDPIVIQAIARAIDEGKIANSQLLVRTSPAEDETRFSSIKQEFPKIKWNHPQWHLTRENHPEPWSQRIPDIDDISQLKAVLKFSDLNVNMCSTMSLDFMLFDKPVINTVFGNGENGLYDDQRFLNFAHYKIVVDSGAVAIAKEKDELIDQITFSLNNPKARIKQQKELIKLQISESLEGTSTRIAEALESVIF